MKSILPSASLLGCFAFGLATAACEDLNDATNQEAPSPTASGDPSQTAPETSSGVDQATIARTTLALESQFSDQFTRGQIERAALQGAIEYVIQAMPEAARPKVQQHVARIVDIGDKLASELTAEQRAAAAAPPTDEKTQQTHEPLVTAWGWPGLAGFGGYGAFAFPGMYSAYGQGYGDGYGYGGYSPDPYALPGYALCAAYAKMMGYSVPGLGYNPGYDYAGDSYPVCGYPAYGYPGYGNGSAYSTVSSHSYSPINDYGLGSPGWFW